MSLLSPFLLGQSATLYPVCGVLHTFFARIGIWVLKGPFKKSGLETGNTEEIDWRGREAKRSRSANALLARWFWWFEWIERKSRDF